MRYTYLGHLMLLDLIIFTILSKGMNYEVRFEILIVMGMTSALKMKAQGFSETLAFTDESTWCQNSQDKH
jgi:hypothetical protein